MIYGSVCSGIEAATAAWHHLGWQPAFFSEIEPFPSEVLKNHYPNTPNYGDLTKYNEWPVSPGSVDLLVGGTPCQSFSVAGLRKGLEDPRGNLCLTFLGLVDRLKPKWVVWENVPGVLSSGQGRDFGSFLGALGEIGYGWAYRILDAQYFGVAQRRRRVFVVGYLGDWARAAEVLFEPESLCGNPPPSREKGQRIAPSISTGAPFSRTGNERVECDAIVVARESGQGYRVEDSVSDTMRTDSNRNGKEGTIVAQPTTQFGVATIAFHPTQDPISSTDGSTHAIGTGSAGGAATVAVATPFGVSDTSHAVAFEPGSIARDAGPAGESPLAPTLRRKMGDNQPAVRINMAVRRLTPVECERLQGFPDNFTRIPWRNKPASECPDGPRYKALGNSMAVPVMRWIGERIHKLHNQP